MRTLYRLTSLSLLFLLALSACSGIMPFAVRGQTLSEDSAQPANPGTTPLAAATLASPGPESPVKAPSATPVSSATQAYPQGCSPARLEQSVLAYTWSDRLRKNDLFPVDSVTAQPLCNFEPLSIGMRFLPTFSPNADRLAIISSRRENGWDSSLRWIDLKNWQMHETGIAFPRDAPAIEFSPDGRKLAIAAATQQANRFQLVLVDLDSQSTLAETTLGFYPRMMRFSSDGTQLVVYGSAESPDSPEAAGAEVMLLDPSTLESRWENALPGVIDGSINMPEKGNSPEGFKTWQPAVVYAPGQEKLYIVHSDADRLTTVDFNARTTSSLEILPATSWIERLLALTAGVAHAKSLDGFFKTGVLSPDGSRLYVLGHAAESSQDKNGNWQFNETPYGLKVIDVATGAEIAQVDTQAGELEFEFSEDGRNLLLRSWSDPGGTQVLDAKTLEEKTHVVKEQLYTGRRLDGQPVVLSIAYNIDGVATLKIVDPSSFADISEGYKILSASWLVERWIH